MSTPPSSVERIKVVEARPPIERVKVVEAPAKGGTRGGKPPYVPAGYIVFAGVGAQTGHQKAFEAIATDPPSITGGYANWAKIPRPLMRAITVPVGYDPVEMTLAVRFIRFTNDGNWIVDQDTNGHLEQAISALEWMAGSRFHEGPSPFVYLFTGNGGNDEGDLIPHEYHGMTWVITGLTWGVARRNNHGHRVWQEATVVLTAWTSYAQAARPPSDKIKGGWFISKAGKDTPLKIAKAPSSNAPGGDLLALAKAILHDKKNAHIPRQKGTHGSGIYRTYKHGAKVWVPRHTGFVNLRGA